MEHNKTWILIADSSKARLYACNKIQLIQAPQPKNLSLIGEYSHEASRMKTSDLVSDRQGELGSGSFTTHVSPKVQEAAHFAQELINYLEKGHQTKELRDFILVAPPAFMGLLKKKISSNLEKVLVQCIEKDYTQDDELKLISQLMLHL